MRSSTIFTVAVAALAAVPALAAPVRRDSTNQPDSETTVTTVTDLSEVAQQLSTAGNDPDAISNVIAQLPADQQTAISNALTNAETLAQSLDGLTADQQAQIVSYVSKHLTRTQKAFIITQLTGQITDSQVSKLSKKVGSLPSPYKSQFEALSADQQLALVEYAVAIDNQKKQTDYINKVIQGSGSSTSASSDDDSASAQSVDDSTSSAAPAPSATSSAADADATDAADSTDATTDVSDDASTGTAAAASTSDDAATTSDDSTSSSSSDDADVASLISQYQSYFNCIDYSTAESMESELVSQGVPQDAVDQVMQAVPSYVAEQAGQTWTAPSSCSSTTSKRSLADLD